jgi:AcrR family transcriptional regulator
MSITRELESALPGRYLHPITETRSLKRNNAPEQATLKPDGRGRGRPVGDREAQRKKILRAGIKVIAREGYAGASLRKVAQEAGHTTGALTYYFADKEELVSAIIDHMFDSFDRLLDTGDDIADHRSRYRQWIELNSQSDSWIAGFQLLANARHEPTFAAVYRERYSRYRQRLTEIIKKQQAAGVVRGDIPADLLADHLSSIGDGWVIMLPIETERFAPERVDALIDSIMRLLQPPSALKSA